MLNTVPMIYDGIGMTILNYVSNMDRSDMVVDFAVINHLEDRMRTQIEGLGPSADLQHAEKRISVPDRVHFIGPAVFPVTRCQPL